MRDSQETVWRAGCVGDPEPEPEAGHAVIQVEAVGIIREAHCLMDANQANGNMAVVLN